MATQAETTTPETIESGYSFTLRWYVLFITMLIYTVSIADRYVFSQVQQQIQNELHLTDSGISLVGGVTLGLFYVTMGLPLSWIADRYNRKNLLTFALAAWSVATAFCGMARTYGQLMFARTWVGVGEAGGTPPCNAIVSDYFAIDRRPMAMTVFALGAPIGAWLGADMAGAVSHAYGWRAAFLVLGMPGVVLSAIVYFTVREPRRGANDYVVAEKTPSLMESLSYIMRQKSGIHVIMGSGLSALWGWGLMWFTPTFIQRAYNMNEAQAGSITGPIHLVMGIGASLATAWLLGRPAFRNPRRIVYLLGGVTALATIPSFLAYYTHELWVAKLMWWIFIPSIYFYIGPAFALGQNLVPPGMRAMFSAIALFVANIFNLVVAPFAIGSLSDHFAGPHGGDAESLRLALLIWAPTGFWAAWHYWRAGKFIVEDQKRAVGHV
jgi:predicted MFS family arabinose efflux permease